MILLIFPHFFQYIQQRPGELLNDPLLAMIPARDASLPIFVFIWGSACVLAWRAIESPTVLLRFVCGYVLLTLTRFVTILSFPLEPPLGLIELTDPLSNYFYGPSFITKDLFFSGHTSTQLLIFLCLERPRERLFALVGTFVVGSLVLVQHVHYSIDVLAVPVFTYPLWWLTLRLTQNASPSVK